MSRQREHLPGDSLVIPTRTSPTTTDTDEIVRLADDDARQLGLPADTVIHVDRARRPVNGDLVWVELVRLGSTERLVRHYAHSDGWVTLTVADRSTPAIMRRRGELLILGVVVGHETSTTRDAARRPDSR